MPISIALVKLNTYKSGDVNTQMTFLTFRASIIYSNYRVIITYKSKRIIYGGRNCFLIDPC